MLSVTRPTGGDEFEEWIWDTGAALDLASEDVNQVMQNLRENGYHLQLPPGDQTGDLI